MKGTEQEKKYCDFLKREIAEIENKFERDRKDSIEFYGGFNGSCEMAVDNLQEEMKNSLLWLFVTATERGVCTENLKKVFGKDFRDLSESYISE